VELADGLGPLAVGSSGVSDVLDVLHQPVPAVHRLAVLLPVLPRASLENHKLEMLNLS
jgi:hypothetical protein